jgi:hypothetical protein
MVVFNSLWTANAIHSLSAFFLQNERAFTRKEGEKESYKKL